MHFLWKKAREGKYVVRLKGGDPYVFGRGGEEMLVLKDEGIPCEEIPRYYIRDCCSCSSGNSCYAQAVQQDGDHSYRISHKQ